MSDKVVGSPEDELGRARRKAAKLKKRLEFCERGFQVHRYVKPDGSFDYERYRAVQEEGNRKKLGSVFVREEDIRFLADYLLRKLGSVSFGLCHGTRRGMEQAWFRQHTGAEVIGTEISETATQFPPTIQWDFHAVKPDWIGACDFIYSNSFDHSYDPEACLRAWVSCLKPDGICILEHSSLHEKATFLDTFGAKLAVMPYLICLWGKGDFAVHEVVPAPQSKGRETHFLMVRKNRP
jgi:hypothetical protein